MKHDLLVLLIALSVLALCCFMAFGCQSNESRLNASTAANGHTFSAYQYRVCSSPGWTQQVTVSVETGQDGPDWPAADVPCTTNPPPKPCPQ